MQSERVFYHDPYIRELEATIVGIEGDALILDTTICYPEGGGQGGDRGFIDTTRLLDTQLDAQGRILHIVEKQIFSVGDTVMIKLDWERRYHFMQMHTAQHMASGILHQTFGIGTRSVHLGEEIMTIETDATVIEEAIIASLEKQVNARIAENRSTAIDEHTREDALALGLRRSIKVETPTVRLVSIDGVDTIACGGLHVKETSEIGLFLYVGEERMRGHVRLIFCVADRAWERVRSHRRAVDALGTLFSAPVDVLAASAERAVEAASVERNKLARLEALYAEARLTQEIARAQEQGLSAFHWAVEEEIPLAATAQASATINNLLLCATQGEGENFLWLIIAKGKESASFDFAAFRSAYFAEFAAKGGGRAPLYQGRGTGDSAAFAARVLEAFT